MGQRGELFVNMKLFLLASIFASVLAQGDGLNFTGGAAAPTGTPDGGDTLSGLLGCESVYYVMFDGPVCGVIAFGANANGGNVTVQTIRDGITGLNESIGPFPYHGMSFVFRLTI